MTLDQANDLFDKEPTTHNAGVYLRELRQSNADDRISVDTFQTGLDKIERFLLRLY